MVKLLTCYSGVSTSTFQKQAVYCCNKCCWNIIDNSGH